MLSPSPHTPPSPGIIAALLTMSNPFYCQRSFYGNWRGSFFHFDWGALSYLGFLSVFYEENSFSFIVCFANEMAFSRTVVLFKRDNKRYGNFIFVETYLLYLVTTLLYCSYSNIYSSIASACMGRLERSDTTASL